VVFRSQLADHKRYKANQDLPKMRIFA